MEHDLRNESVVAHTEANHRLLVVGAEGQDRAGEGLKQQLFNAPLKGTGAVAGRESLLEEDSDHRVVGLHERVAPRDSPPAQDLANLAARDASHDF